jgi:predicted alpha/beta-hydrolase family hydrolase
VTPAAEVRDVSTPQGTARLHVHQGVGRPDGTLVLGHGAGGRSWSADLRTLADTLPGEGWSVVLVDQPWRVSGRKVATPPPTLDAAWVPVLEALGHDARARGLPLVVGGRSAGARVACRTAEQVRADGVLCLSFPLHPPGRPERSRAEELLAPVHAGIPTCVVQGERDPFGRPDEVVEYLGDPAAVHPVAGNHTLTAPVRDILPVVRAFLAGVPTGRRQ